MKKIRELLMIFRVLFILPGVNWGDHKFLMDLERWKKVENMNERNVVVLGKLLWIKKEFRNLFIYRNSNRPIYRRWIAFWYSPLTTLYIETPEIGGGLFIQHGFSTMIAAKSIGENCWINQQVTIGYNGHSDPPRIGNNVMITCGAKVLGNITIGNNVVIGANAVVIKNVENDAVIGGIPARRIR